MFLSDIYWGELHTLSSSIESWTWQWVWTYWTLLKTLRRGACHTLSWKYFTHCWQGKETRARGSRKWRNFISFKCHLRLMYTKCLWMTERSYQILRLFVGLKSISELRAWGHADTSHITWIISSGPWPGSRPPAVVNTVLGEIITSLLWTNIFFG